MKKNILRIAIVALVGAMMASCMGPEEVTFSQSDLLGLWQEDNTEHFVRFTTEKADEVYLYGREWNEAEDIFEGDLKPYGNGWFKWQLVKADLKELHLMDNDGAEIPKTYIVTKLTDTELSYYEKDHKEIKTSFTKVAEKK